MIMDFMIPIGMLTIHISKIKSKEVLRDEEFSNPSHPREKKFEKFSAIVRSYTEIKSVRLCKRDVLQECNKDCVNIRQLTLSKSRKRRRYKFKKNFFR